MNNFVGLLVCDVIMDSVSAQVEREVEYQVYMWSTVGSVHCCIVLLELAWLSSFRDLSDDSLLGISSLQKLHGCFNQ